MNQIAGLMFVPFMAISVAAVEGSFPFTVLNLLAVSGVVVVVVVVVDVTLFCVSRFTFSREERY